MGHLLQRFRLFFACFACLSMLAIGCAEEAEATGFHGGGGTVFSVVAPQRQRVVVQQQVVHQPQQVVVERFVQPHRQRVVVQQFVQPQRRFFRQRFRQRAFRQPRFQLNVGRRY